MTTTESHFFPRLFEPIRIGSLDVRNRIVLTGHGTGMGRDFRPNEQLIRYYEERAKGGAGLLMIGFSHFCKNSVRCAAPRTLGIVNM